MSKFQPLTIDSGSAPFDRYTGLRWLAPERSGHDSSEQGRHQLFTGRERHNPVNVLIKVTSKPGLVYEQDLDNEFRSLSTINRRLPRSSYFPFVHDQGRLPDGRRFLVTSLFDEFPLATLVGPSPEPALLVRDLRIGIEIARGLAELHGIDIVHVDLNPMNVLYRTGADRPVIRIVDFESSYEKSRHATLGTYNPPTTAGFTAPEVAERAPDARSDVFSLGAVMSTLLTGYQRWPVSDPRSRVEAEATLDADLKSALLRALDREPDRRFQDVEQFQAALGAYLEHIWPGRRW
jgi:serine/threonine protein kinase